MNERKGEVFSIAEENAPVEGCTVSKTVAEVAGRRISHFALSAGTDISPETYDYHKLWIVIDGEGEVLAAKNAKIAKGDAFVTPVGQPVGVKTEMGIVYTEIETGKEHKMKLNPGEAFSLKDVLPYAEGRIVNKDIINEPKLKFVLMSFAADGFERTRRAGRGADLRARRRGRDRLRGQGTHHQSRGELCVRQERRTLGPRRKAVQDGFAANIGLTNKRRIKMRAYVDQELCIGCGLCTSIAPDVFAMNADGKAEAVSDTTDANGESVKQAIEGCPVAAIRETE